MAEEVKIKRDEKGRFLIGTQAPNPHPKGAPRGKRFSIDAKIREVWETDPAGFDLWVKQYMRDPANSKAIHDHMDGKAKQSIEHGGDVSLPFTINVSKYEDDEPERKQINAKPKELTEGGAEAEEN